MTSLHKEGKIRDSALDKALNALQPAQNVEQVEKRSIIRYSNAEKVRTRRRKKNKAKKKKIAEFKKNVIK